ncbi:SurA N-terminal domain-containing protein [Limoniibacter endophyticus]|uniref:Parvulin-like PPIase n=1 Tax=Limoniibacter endophyticus TaxID=1565040 RepID=A0A8J3GEK3_9HYPH|nr:SurA N-terminal domain-containing protein [Limoniibacter endophyticus]GHC60926.1 peptidylprolyl isomerase [Limoniibacter endophyticus]
MLDSLRGAANTWVVKILLLLLVASFGAWGISGTVFDNVGGNFAISAGETTVSPTEYRLAYERQISVYSQQLGQRLTREQARAYGIENQVQSSLVSGALLDEEARLLGLGISEQQIAELTRSDPSFQNGGQFSRQAFDYVLAQVGMRPEDYFATRSKESARQQIISTLSDGVKTPEVFLSAVAVYRGETRNIAFVHLPQSAVEPIETPTDEQLSTYFDQNKSQYAAPEYRKLIYATLTPESIADPNAVTEEQIIQDYEANEAQFTTPEMRQVQQLLYPDEEAANAAREKLNSGVPFEQLITESGRTEADVSLGNVTREQIPDAAIAEAAFSLQVGEVSAPVKSSFGSVLLRVTNITPERVQALDEAREQIRTDLAQREATRVIADMWNEYEDLRAGGATLAEAASQLQISAVTIDAIDAQGNNPEGEPVPDLPLGPQLVSQAFQTEPGVENPALDLGTTGYLFYEVIDVIAPRDRTLDEVRDRVVSDWTRAETQKRLQDRADQIREEIAGGKALEAVAQELGSTVESRLGIRRDGTDSTLGQAGVQAVFDIKEGEVGIANAAEGDGRLIFQITQTMLPAGDASALSAQDRQGIDQGVGADLLEQIVTRLRGKYDVRVNQTAIDQALAF